MAGAKVVLIRPKAGERSQKCKKTRSSESSPSPTGSAPDSTVSAKGGRSQSNNGKGFPPLSHRHEPR
jgi:hypothetical protein